MLQWAHVHFVADGFLLYELVHRNELCNWPIVGVPSEAERYHSEHVYIDENFRRISVRSSFASTINRCNPLLEHLHFFLIH